MEPAGCVLKMNRQILKGFGLGMHKETPLEPAGVNGWYPGGRSGAESLKSQSTAAVPAGPGDSALPTSVSIF